MMPAVPCRIVIFAKAPVPGAVKTRLIPVLGADRAARLAEQMFHHTLDQALAAARQASRLSVEICTPDTTHVFWEPVHLSGKATITPQGDGDLGQRMLRAVRRVSGEGAACVLIGSDCPSLTADHGCSNSGSSGDGGSPCTGWRLCAAWFAPGT